MSKIDVSQWKEFNIGKLFDFYRGKEVAPNRVPDGAIPFISETRANNGMVKLASSEHIFSGKSITVSVNYASTVLYQEKDFCASVNIIVLHNDKLTVNAGLFLVAVISKLHQKYSYNDKVSAFKLKQENIKLPIDSLGNPDWQYMDEYIAKLATQAHTNISLLRQQQKKAPTVNIDRWKEFKISDIYPIIQHPRTRSKKDYEQGSMPFIASGSTNNGIDCYLEPKDKNDYEKADCLTVSPVDGSCFYQSKPFLARGGGGSSILILRSKSKLNEAVHIFLATIITRKLKENYSFNTMGNSKSIANVKIKLPVTESDEPDWQYMDKYISSIQQVQKERVARLTSIIK